MLLGVDVGGTFTDAVLAVDGRLVTAKSPTTPEDQSRGVMAAVAAVLERAQRRAEDVVDFSHGMTVATNALLEGQGARAAFAATRGFTDMVALARQDRPELYRLCAARPAPLVPEGLRFAVDERMGPDGPLRALGEHDEAELADAVQASGVEAVAIVLLHSYRHPEHERRLAAALAERLPNLHISVSHEVVGTFREYERAATTEVDAAISPLLGRYLRRLAVRCRSERLPAPAIMQSNGGLIDIESAAQHAAWTVLSGPAAGAAGAAFIARACGEPSALCFDMGGTSCDVCVVRDGAVQERAAGEVAGRPIALPMLAVHTVGAGGGSIAWRDAGGALRVGPGSAGADPGPACYRRGGTQPTVTDANMLLGLLGDEVPLAGAVALDRDAAEAAVGRLASELAMDAMECAEGIVRVAVAEMVGALRVVTVQRGIDPRGYALLAFGGAGPLHAVAIADELGMDTVLCPRASGVLAALGLVVSERRRDIQRSLLLSGSALSGESIARATAELAAQARSALGADDAALEATYELRYVGQSFELAVAGPLDATPQMLRTGFEAEHERHYGYTDPEQPLELVTLRVTARSSGAQITTQAAQAGDEPERSRRRARLSGAEVELEIVRGAPTPGTKIEGPAAVDLAESTVLIPIGWGAEVDATGSLRLTRA